MLGTNSLDALRAANFEDLKDLDFGDQILEASIPTVFPPSGIEPGSLNVYEKLQYPKTGKVFEFKGRTITLISSVLIGRLCASASAIYGASMCHASLKAVIANGLALNLTKGIFITQPLFSVTILGVGLIGVKALVIDRRDLRIPLEREVFSKWVTVNGNRFVRLSQELGKRLGFGYKGKEYGFGSGCFKSENLSVKTLVERLGPEYIRAEAHDLLSRTFKSYSDKVVALQRKRISKKTTAAIPPPKGTKGPSKSSELNWVVAAQKEDGKDQGQAVSKMTEASEKSGGTQLKKKKASKASSISRNQQEKAGKINKGLYYSRFLAYAKAYKELGEAKSERVKQIETLYHEAIFNLDEAWSSRRRGDEVILKQMEESELPESVTAFKNNLCDLQRHKEMLRSEYKAKKDKSLQDLEKQFTAQVEKLERAARPLLFDPSGLNIKFVPIQESMEEA